MLGILLDSAVILGLAALFNEGETPGWGMAIVTALGVSFGSVGCVYLLYDYVGILSIIPMPLVAGILLWGVCDVPFKKALIAGGILFVYKIAITLFWAAVLV